MRSLLHAPSVQSQWTYGIDFELEPLSQTQRRNISLNLFIFIGIDISRTRITFFLSSVVQYEPRKRKIYNSQRVKNAITLVNDFTPFYRKSPMLLVTKELKSGFRAKKFFLSEFVMNF
jgi:hypothetical protein